MRFIKGALLSLCLASPFAIAATIPTQANGSYSSYCQEE
jgi:hypothetical protein